MKKLVAKIVIVLLIVMLLLSCAGGLYYYFYQYPIAPKLKDDSVQIACVGDSLTFGAGVALHRSTLSFPALMQSELGDKYNVLNYGLSGRTLLSSGDRPYTAEKFYQKSLDAKAEIYIIMLGSNDSKPYNWNAEKYEEELKSFVETYMAVQESPRVYLMQPSKCFPVGEEVQFDIKDEVIADGIYNAVARVAEETGAGLIDLYTLTSTHPEWYDDGVHPNEEGNRAIAKYICESIQADL